MASNNSYIDSPRQRCEPGWQKLCEGTKGLRQKVWTRTKIWSPNIRYFVAILRFVAIDALFGRLWARKMLFWVKTVFLGQEVHYYMVYIAYFTELILQIQFSVICNIYHLIVHFLPKKHCYWLKKPFSCPKSSKKCVNCGKS